MSEPLEYSNEALNVKAQFYSKKIMCYVEAEDDKYFWSQFFPNFVQIESKGCCTQLDILIPKICSGDVFAIVARDRDYLEFKNQLQNHHFVLYTFGHSIENTLLENSCVDFICSSHSREEYDRRPAGEKYISWLEKVQQDFKKLLQLEIAKEVENIPIEVIGRHCARFFDANHKILRNVISKLESNVENKISKEIHQKISFDESDIPLLLRGHFYASLVKTFINSSFNKKIQDSDLIERAILIWNTNHKNNRHFEYYDQLCKKAIEYV